MGDVIVEGNNLYGEGVNIAARLEALSQSGGVCLSKSIMDFVNNKTELNFHDQGEQKIKNTNVHAFDLVDPNLEHRKLKSELTEDSDVSKAPNIAVLPFSNLSNDPEQDYFADGITEDIISHLSQWKTFPVISSNSVFVYKDTKETTRKIADELGARYLVMGSVRKGGNKVRINVKLVNCENDTQIWSQNWDRALDDIFEIQDEVSQKVAVIISPALKLNEMKRLGEKKNVIYSSWDEYLRASSCLNKSDQTKGLPLADRIELKRKAIKHGEKAIELDENFGEPHVIICAAIMDLLFEPSLSSERDANQKKFLYHCEKGVELDPNNPDAVIMQGLKYFLMQNLDRFEEVIQKALSLNPNHPRTLMMYSIKLQRDGNFDKAIEYIKLGMEIDPASRGDWENWLMFSYIAMGDYKSAMNSLNWCMDYLFHNRHYGFKAAILALEGNIEESKEWLAKYLEARPEITSLDDYRKVVPEMNDYLKNNLIEGMKLAGLS